MIETDIEKYEILEQNLKRPLVTYFFFRWHYHISKHGISKDVLGKSVLQVFLLAITVSVIFVLWTHSITSLSIYNPQDFWKIGFFCVVGFVYPLWIIYDILSIRKLFELRTKILNGEVEVTFNNEEKIISQVISNSDCSKRENSLPKDLKFEMLNDNKLYIKPDEVFEINYKKYLLKCILCKMLPYVFFMLIILSVFTT